MIHTLLLLLTLSVGPESAQPESPPSAPASQSPAAPDAAPRNVESLLLPIVQRTETPGLVAGAIVDGRLVALGAAGTRVRGKAEPVTADDKFHLGSCTKTFTATLCALMVQDGSLRWDLTLADAFPELKDQMQPQYRQATLLDLLHHRAGIPSDLNPTGVWLKMWQHPGPPEKARADLLPEVLKLPPAVDRGVYLYSNASYSIAGQICERIAKQPFEALLAERLLKPLGITSAGYGAPGSADKIDQPRGHRNNIPVLPSKLADNPSAIAPANALHMNPRDWGKFVALHLAGARRQPNLLLPPDSFDQLLRPAPRAAQDQDATPEYACGWIAVDRPWAGGRAFTHSGSNTMWYATVWLAPEKNLAVFAATNAADQAAQTAVDEACAAMVTLVTPPPQVAPAAEAPQ